MHKTHHGSVIVVFMLESVLVSKQGSLLLCLSAVMFTVMPTCFFYWYALIVQTLQKVYSSSVAIFSTASFVHTS